MNGMKRGREGSERKIISSEHKGTVLNFAKEKTGIHISLVSERKILKIFLDGPKGMCVGAWASLVSI